MICKQQPALGFVIYGSNPYKRLKMKQWQQRLGIGQAVVINNKPGDKQEDEVAGDNSHFEFSAYQQLSRLLPGDGPFILVNDTLFKNHWEWAWARLCRIALRRLSAGENTLWGDVRIEGGHIPERPNTYLASWIFVVPNRMVLSKLEDKLAALLLQEQPPPSMAYQQYLDNWLYPKVWYKGWHGKRTEADNQRKLRSVKLEHALSRQLPAAQIQIRSLGHFLPALYKMIRLADRLITRTLALHHRT